MLRGNQLGLRFRRQHPIGVYIVDFYYPSARLCVEVDGPAHNEPDQAERDAPREEWLKAQGLRVIRFSADDIHSRPAAVVAAIARAATTPSVAFGATSPALRAGEDAD